MIIHCKHSGECARVSKTDNAIQANHIPMRPASDLGAPIIEFDHGTVAADWGVDSAANKVPAGSNNLYITDISLVVATDPTAELANQIIPVVLEVYDDTDSETRYKCTFGIPSNCHVELDTPIKITTGHNYHTKLQLGGATALDLDVIINGYEEES